jgi:Kyakuja-Dileera-Zisupton transposase
MDYLFFSALKASKGERFVVSYDIACQWSVNLWERLENDYCEWMEFDHENRQIVFLVPKFHLPAHTVKCQNNFSFNLTPHVGRTDGEGVERGWSKLNPLSRRTREMGPGGRRDAIDAHCGDLNHTKVVGMGEFRFYHYDF